MPELIPGVVVAPAAGGQPVVQPAAPAGGQPAGQPGAAAPAAPAAGGAAAKEVMVPLTVVEAIRNELSTMKGKNSELEAKLVQVQFATPAPGAAAAAAPAAPAAPADPLEGMEDDELINVKDIRKIIQTVRQGGDQSPLKTAVAQLQLQVMDPNYEATIRTYLPEMVTANPMLKGMITRAENPLAAALAVARMSPKFQAALAAAKGGGAAPAPPPDILSDLQRIIENASKPAAPGAMGGGGGAVAGNDRFRTMSDADFDAEVNRVLAGAQR